MQWLTRLRLPPKHFTCLPRSAAVCAGVRTITTFTKFPTPESSQTQDRHLARNCWNRTRHFSQAAASAVSEDYQHLNFNLLYSAATGDLVTVAQCLDQGADVNFVDYDKRCALHLAAEEGKLAVVKTLVEAGASVNLFDRNGYSPLEGAILGKHHETASYLVSKGSAINTASVTSITKAMLNAAATADVECLSLLINSGADVNVGDYDYRTPLHLAAAEGKVQIVEFLIQHGADIHAVDRFGSTPLSDAYNGVSRGHRAVRRVLEEHGVCLASMEGNSTTSMLPVISQCLPVFFERGNFEFAEAFVTYGSTTDEVYQTDGSSKVPKSLEGLSGPAKGRMFQNSGEFGNAWHNKQPCLIPLSEASLPQSALQTASDAGIQSVLLLPVSADHSTTVAMLALYTSDVSLTDEAIADFGGFANRMFNAGLWNTKTNRDEVEPPMVTDHPKVSLLLNDVWKMLVHQAVFPPTLLFHEVDWFCHMIGPNSGYFRRLPPEILAQHIHAYIAAKKFSSVSIGNPEKIWLHVENNPAFSQRGGEQALIMLNDEDHFKRIAAERILQRRITHVPTDKACQVKYFTAHKPILPGGNSKLGIYLLETCDFANPHIASTNESNIWDLGSEMFLEETVATVRDRYKDIIAEVVGHLAPRTRVHAKEADGCFPILFASQQGQIRHSSYALQLTDLAYRIGLQVNRKYVETFSNGITVYSLYIDGNGHEDSAILENINSLLNQFAMLHLLPDSGFTPQFLQGNMSANVYAYSSAASRCVYYFINERSEEMDSLLSSLGPDSVNASRLRLLNTSMKREAVSMNRIYEIVEQYLPLMEELARDFTKRATTCWEEEGEVPRNKELIRRIDTESTSSTDHQVLNAFMSFNCAVLKTNFFKARKSSLSFRLDPTKLNGDWPATPFGVFFLMGAEFQGFHIRFEDVSRGGIRLIHSRDNNSYATNLSTQWAETYGLAYTQNKKNKDIPEFGSKGTILLNRTSQENGLIAFRKYISGLLDLLTPNPEIVDNYAMPEILFLGPDEGTADKMQIAAEYAKSKGYPYWRSFTTGKPNSMGGIPHDTYGMTTRSVHRYVLGTLKKMGLKEEEVTKAQIGGPDGDLGSNEILISKDKTICIVDGSGVVYDPAGLNRTETVRLAKKRAMINQFDESYLGEGGFKILVNDKNVTLPNGEVVSSGLAFRNNFHLHPLCQADMFVPCGGRPESVSIGNVRQLIDKDGNPRFKIIVEGANLFFTNDARMVLEQAGCVHFKDASTNKGGVTSSSLEVLAALALDDFQFEKHMAVKNNKPSPFYEAYCTEIQKRIENDADKEFECIWRERKSGKPNYILTENLSDKINYLNEFVRSSTLWQNEHIRKTVLMHAIPQTLMAVVGYDNLLERVPDNYLKAIFAAYLSSRYVYEKGIESNEFAFFDFMQGYIKKE